MRRPPYLFVGEAFGKWEPGKSWPLWPIPNSAGARLQKYTGLDTEEFILGTERVNLFLDAPEKWSKVQAEIAAKGIAYYAFVNGQVLVLLGRNVAKAFGVPPQPFDRDQAMFQLEDEWEGTRFKPKVGKVPAITIPHTSGRCRDWNDPRVVELATEFFGELRTAVRHYMDVELLREHW